LSGTGDFTSQTAGAAAAAFSDTSSTTWGLQAVGANTTTLTGRGIKVCIIDSGIDATHPEIQNRPAGLQVRSFVNDAGNDLIGHGTHVAGTACGRRDSTLGYGVAPDAQLFVAKVIDPVTQLAQDGDILSAIEWAVANGCQVVNMSLSATVLPGQPFSGAFEVAAQQALQAGTLLIAAAGNNSNRPSGLIAPVGHPANCPREPRFSPRGRWRTYHFPSRTCSSPRGRATRSTRVPAWPPHM
jgi:subtilisin family serine protease